MLKLFNTLSRKKEVFKPLEGGVVKFYACGPTSYDFAHIGNFRAYLASDLLHRYLEYKGFRVKQVMNITDVDDKTIRGARAQGISLKEFTRKYEAAFFEDLDALGIKRASVYPRATEHILEMIALIQKLLEKRFAYKGSDGSVYYNVSKFKEYGKLSHLNVSELKAGARVSQDSYDKTQASDFALWKAWSKEDGEVFWNAPAPLGKGRPGWHIECSAMSMKYLGETFDIHAGGVDLIFPHHENEIAQSEGATGKQFVRYWFHNEHLLVEGRKMAKSLGNFFTLRDILAKGFSPKAVRFLLLSAHYRQQLNFTFNALENVENTVARLEEFVSRLNESNTGKAKDVEVKKSLECARKEFIKQMDDDLNAPLALAAVFNLVKEANKAIAENALSAAVAREVKDFMLNEFNAVFGVIEEKPARELGKEAKKLIQEREQARARGDFKRADEIRLLLRKQGIILEDSKNGVKWKFVK